MFYKNLLFKLFQQWEIFVQRIMINNLHEIIVKDPTKSILISVKHKIHSLIRNFTYQ